MTDALPIIEATKLGYAIYSDADNMAWYMLNNRATGPYKTLEEAAYDAIAEHETNAAFKFWKSGDSTV